MNELRGKVIEIFDEESGVSKAGKEWKNQKFILETEDKYPKKVCCVLFGDKTDMIHSKSIGNEVDVKFEVESRGFNGKWFTNVNAFAVNLVQGKSESSGLPPSESITHGERYKRAVTLINWHKTKILMTYRSNLKQ